MRLVEILTEGGWASVKTQDTVITPLVLKNVVGILSGFEKDLNNYLTSKNIPTIKIGRPVGSGTYYERDLAQRPDAVYGDIDVQFIVPRISDLNHNQIQQLYSSAVQEFCNHSSDYETDNGKNVILQIGDDQYVQIDLVSIYTDTVECSDILSPEWKTKGVLCASLYSALAEVLNLSISSAGIQAKKIGNDVVKFNVQKGTTLHTVSTNREQWGIDVVRFLGGNKISPALKQNPGYKGEVKIADIVATIKGIAQSLEASGKINSTELLQNIKQSYLGKINKVVTSTKFDKAASPAAVEKANKTKETLSTRSQEIAGLLT